MKFMLATFYNEKEATESVLDMSEEDMHAMMSFMEKLNKELMDSGEFVDANGLGFPKESKTVRLIDGAAVTTDGPFAEAKEVLAGYWVLDCVDFYRACEIAAKVVEFMKEPIEVRPVTG